jgi:hypothetical protein
VLEGSDDHLTLALRLAFEILEVREIRDVVPVAPRRANA